MVPKQISNPEVRRDSESKSEENGNENRRKHRTLFHENALTPSSVNAVSTQSSAPGQWGTKFSRTQP